MPDAPTINDLLNFVIPYLGDVGSAWQWDSERHAAHLFTQGELTLWNETFAGRSTSILEGVPVSAAAPEGRLQLRFALGQPQDEAGLLRLIATFRRLLLHEIAIERVHDSDGQGSFRVDARLVRRDGRAALIPTKVTVDSRLLANFVLFSLLLPFTEEGGALRGFDAPPHFLGQLGLASERVSGHDQMACLLNLLYTYRVLRPAVRPMSTFPYFELDLPANAPREKLAPRIDPAFFQAVASLAGLTLAPRTPQALAQLPPEQCINAGRHRNVLQLGYRFIAPDRGDQVGADLAVCADFIPVDPTTRVAPRPRRAGREPCLLQRFLWRKLADQDLEDPATLDVLVARLREARISQPDLSPQVPLQTRFWLLLQQKLTALAGRADAQADALAETLARRFGELRRLQADIAAASADLNSRVTNCVDGIRAEWRDLFADAAVAAARAVPDAHAQVRDQAERLRQTLAGACGFGGLAEAGKGLETALAAELDKPVAAMRDATQILRQTVASCCDDLQTELAATLDVLHGSAERLRGELSVTADAGGGAAFEAPTPEEGPGSVAALGRKTEDAVRQVRQTVAHAVVDEQSRLLTGLRRLGDVDPVREAGQAFVAALGERVETGLRQIDERLQHAAAGPAAVKQRLLGLREQFQHLRASVAGLREEYAQQVNGALAEIADQYEHARRRMAQAAAGLRDSVESAFLDRGAQPQPGPEEQQAPAEFAALLLRLQQGIEPFWHAWADRAATVREAQHDLLRQVHERAALGELEGAIRECALNDAVTGVETTRGGGVKARGSTSKARRVSHSHRVTTDSRP